MLVRLSLLGGAAELALGEEFQLVIELAEKAANPITIAVIAQRLLEIDGRYELRPTHQYFDTDPSPFTIPMGPRYGLSNVIKISSTPSIPDEEPPLNFPEHLLFTAWLPPDQAKFESVTVRVARATRLSPTR